MTEFENITAIILAGGKSSRMGSDKGLMDFQGIELAGHVIQNLSAVVNGIMIISGNPAYKKFGIPVFEDIHKDCGPLGGIHSGLTNSKTGWNLVVGCDLPFITADFYRFLLSQITNADAIVPVHDSKAEPLCALYHQSALPEIESLLLRGELKMQTVVKRLNSVFPAVPEKTFDPSVLFKNFNTPEDLASPLIVSRPDEII